jgi:hypothetical protein
MMFHHDLFCFVHPTDSMRTEIECLLGAYLDGIIHPLHASDSTPTLGAHVLLRALKKADFFL